MTMTRSNLLILLSDEQDARALGCAGHPWVHTPHLDALAARGTRFTNTFTPSPICVPARASLATGRWVHQDGRYWDNAMAYYGVVSGWCHALKDAGTRHMPACCNPSQIGCTSGWTRWRPRPPRQGRSKYARGPVWRLHASTADRAAGGDSDADRLSGERPGQATANGRAALCRRP